MLKTGSNLLAVKKTEKNSITKKQKKFWFDFKESKNTHRAERVMFCTIFLFAAIFILTLTPCLFAENKKNKTVRMKPLTVTGSIETPPSLLIPRKINSGYNIFEKSLHKEIITQFKPSFLPLYKNYNRLIGDADVSYEKDVDILVKGNSKKILPFYTKYKIGNKRTEENKHLRLYNEGVIFLRSKNIKSIKFAINRFEKAIKIKEDFCPAHYNLAYSYYKKGLYEEADKHLRRCQ